MCPACVWLWPLESPNHVVACWLDPKLQDTSIFGTTAKCFLVFLLVHVCRCMHQQHLPLPGTSVPSDTLLFWKTEMWWWVDWLWSLFLWCLVVPHNKGSNCDIIPTDILFQHIISWHITVDCFCQICERSLSRAQGGPMIPPVPSFVRAEILPSGYLIRPCEGGGCIIHIVDHMDLEACFIA